MNWKMEFIFEELGLVFVVLLIPFVLGRLGIKSPWPMLMGWFAAMSLAFFLDMERGALLRAGHLEAAGLIPDFFLLATFGLLAWLPASYLGAWGERQRKRRIGK